MKGEQNDLHHPESGCNRKEIISNVINCFVVTIVGIIILIINRTWDPFKRGFFCDDESIQYPHHDSTIPSSVMYGVGFSLNIISFLVIEAVLLRHNRKNRSVTNNNGERSKNWLHGYFCSTFNVLLPFLFGAATVQLITDIAKYSVGRLRPHYLAVCKPDYSLFNCSDGYITADVCTGDATLIKHARVSFPSGHASFSMYAMIFLVLYYQARLVWKGLLLLRPLLQLFVFCLAFYTGLSRIYDYKHHWSDVLCGDILGVIVAVVTFLTLTEFGFSSKSKEFSQIAEKEEFELVKVTSSGTRPVTKL